jgi:hypothetical protein
LNEALPVVVGVPETTPADESVSPAGSAPDASVKWNGATPLETVSAWL